MIERLNPEQVAQRLADDPDVIYLDVRSSGEFAQGHVPGARNIPIMEPDAGGFMRPNAEFQRVVEAVIPKEARVIVGCKAGPRSDAAARILDQMGYDHVADMVGGFCGATDERGQAIVAGWQHFDLPVSNEPASGCSYANMLDQAGAGG